MHNLTICELSDVSSLLVRNLKRSIEDRIKLDMDFNDLPDTPQGQRLIEVFVAYSLTDYSDIIAEDLRSHNFGRFVDDFTPFQLELYGNIIKGVSGSSANVQLALIDYIKTKVDNRLAEAWFTSVAKMAEEIISDMALCQDDWWVDNFTDNKLFRNKYAILDVKVKNGSLYIDDLGDYRIKCWELLSIIRQNRYTGRPF